MLRWFKRSQPVPAVGSSSNPPDFSDIDSQSKAEEAFRHGRLERLLLVPREFGGANVPDNRLFVPPGVSKVKAGVDLNVIAPLIAEGKLSQYNVIPRYQGTSFVPIALEIVASDPGSFSTTINIWGDALSEAL